MLTNFIPPYRLPLYEAIDRRLHAFRILLSTPMEGDRTWRPDWGQLDVRVQRVVTLRINQRHPRGFRRTTFQHIPLDTFHCLRSLRPDVVVSSELGARSLFAALFCFGRERPKLILWATLSERTEEGRGLTRRLLRRWLLRRADRVIVNGASGARYVSRFGVPQDRIERVPYVAAPSFACVDRPSRAGGIRTLLYAGQLIQLKGLAPFIEALDAWCGSHPDRQLVLVVVGDGPGRDQLEAMRRQGRVEIRLLGERDPAELQRLLADADAFVFPTLGDEWGVVVNEALSVGLPVLGSIHSQAVEELCTDGVTGWTFDPDDQSSILAAIDRALATPSDRLRNMSDCARRRMEGLTPERAAEQIVSVITRVHGSC